MKVTFVTSNQHKAEEAAGILSGIAELDHISLECPEIRAESVQEVVRGKALYAYDQIGRPVIADDTGLFIPALNGFPGTCAAYVQKTIGNGGILKLLEGSSDRSGWFETAIAYSDGTRTEVFTGHLDGRIVSPRGSNGFGYDPIFEVDHMTLAEMSLAEKNRISHRSRGIMAFRDWLEGYLEG